MFCKYCGTYLEEGSFFCGNCGNKIQPRHTQMSQQQAQQQNQQQNQQQQPFQQQNQQQQSFQQRPFQEAQPPYTTAAPEADYQPQHHRRQTSHIPPVSHGASIASSGAKMAGHAMHAAGKGIRTVHKTRNTIITIALIVGILVTAFSLYLKYFVNGPEDTINAFFEAYNSSDINGMIECMDPTYQNAYSAVSDIAGSLVSEFTGFDVDFGQLADLAPYLAEAEGLLPDAELISVDISYSGNKLASFLAESPVNIIGIEKVLASDATATITFTVEGQTYTEDIPLATYGWGDWRIEAFSLAEQLAGGY